MLWQDCMIPCPTTATTIFSSILPDFILILIIIDSLANNIPRYKSWFLTLKRIRQTYSTGSSLTWWAIIQTTWNTRKYIYRRYLASGINWSIRFRILFNAYLCLNQMRISVNYNLQVILVLHCMFLHLLHGWSLIGIFFVFLLHNSYYILELSNDSIDNLQDLVLINIESKNIILYGGYHQKLCYILCIYLYLKI